MKRNFLAAIVIVFPHFPELAADTTLSAGNDFEISIPSDWIEIPRDVLDQYEVAVKEAVGQSQSYEYGYQSTSAANWFDYPYALVQVKRNGRVPEGQLKEYKKIESGFKEGIEKIEKSASDLLANVNMGEAVYEEGKHILWSNMSVDVSDVAKVNGLIAVKLTEYGVIQFMGYEKEEYFSKIKPTYEKMIYSITVSSSDAYKPHLIDNFPAILGVNLGQTLIAAIIGGLIGGVIGLFKYFTRKNSKKSNNRVQ